MAEWKPEFHKTIANPDAGLVDMYRVNAGEGEDIETAITIAVPHGDAITAAMVCTAVNRFRDGAAQVDGAVVGALIGLARAPWYPCRRRRQALAAARVSLRVTSSAVEAHLAEVKNDALRLKWYRGALATLRDLAAQYGVDPNLGWKEWRDRLEERLARIGAEE